MAGFDLIPVIDLKDGMVVHAREGRRAEYRPVESRLAPGAEPSRIVAALLALHAFRNLYIADLDAIERRGDNLESIRSIRRNFPEVDLWADTGVADSGALERWLDAGLGRPVIGSESLHDAGFMALARDRRADASLALSLDYRGDHFLGPPALLTHPARHWPQRILAMNLQRVGSDKGPDLGLVVGLANRVPGCRVYAAGGVRSAADLETIMATGAMGALLASALHDGRIGSDDLARFEETAARHAK